MLMFHSTSAFSRACRDRNEDAYVVGDDFIVVADGASGVGKNYMKGWRTDAQWFASTLTKELASIIAKDRGRTTIPRLVSQALRILHQQWYEVIGMYMHNKLPSYVKPSAALTVVRLNNKTQEVEAYTLGDSTILIGLKNGTTVNITDETNCLRDASLLAEASAAAKEQRITLREVLPQFKERKLTARSEMNTVEGYWIADMSGEGVQGGILRTFPLDEVYDVAAMTDGYAAALEVLESITRQSMPKEQALMNALRDDAIIEVGKEVVSTLEKDVDFERFPRTKLVDDATVVHGVIG